MRIMGLDYGTRRIGVAICDELEIAALPAPTVEVDGGHFERIAEMVRDRAVELIVVGLPLRLDGTEGPASRKVRSFIKRLRKEVPGVEVTTMDERLTTAQAQSALSEAGARGRERREHVDGMAAQIILQRYLERRRAR
jgi:putative Holliday junction resolvase